METASVRPHAEASEAPGAVTSLTATSGNRTLDIAWQAPSGAIAGYDVHITASSTVDDDADPVTRGRPETGWRHTWNAYTGLVPSHTFDRLTNGTAHRVRVRATNSQGAGPWEFVTATPGTVPGKPAVTLDAVNQELRVSWTEPESTHSAITGYAVQYKESDAADAPASSPNDPSTGWVAHAHSGAGRTATIGGLTDGTGYDVRVRAANALGDGPWSDAAQGTPAPTVPAAPARPTATATADATELAMSWTAPDDRGSAITAYHVQYILHQGHNWRDWSTDLTGTSTTITGLRPAGLYNVRVRARNAAGWGAWSPLQDFVTQSTVPGEPAVTVHAGDGGLGVSWSAAANGSAITGYTVEYKESDAADAPATTPNDPSTGWVAHAHSGTGRTAMIAGLTNGTGYDVRVRATNAIGDGPWSDAAQGTPASGRPPDTPAQPTATADVIELAVSWTAPYDGGSAITAYQVQHAPNVQGSSWSTWRDDLTGTATTITGLSAGTGYWVRVRARNANGWGAWSPNLLTNTRSTVWSATLNVKALGSGKTGCDNAVAAGRCSSSAVLTDNGFRAGGADIAIRTIEDTAPGTGASANFFVQFSTSNDALKALNFCVGSTAHALSTLTSGHFLTKNAPGLVWEAGDTVSLSIGATCQAGTPPTSAPGAPTGLQLEPGNARLDLQWTAATGTVAGYDVHYTSAPATGQDAVENNAELASDSNAATGWVDARHSGRRTAHAITGLANGTAYRVRVRAVNAAGAGAWLHGTGMPVLPPPAAPTRLAVSPSDAKLDLSWTAPAGTLTGYDVHYTASATVAPDAAPGSDAAAAWVAVSRTEADPPAASESITGLTNGTRYRVRVRAENTAGAGAWAFGAGAPSATGTVWSATLTAQALGSDAVGCDNSVGGAQCSSTSVLTEDDFRAGGADISVRELRDTGTGTGAGARFFVQFSGSNNALKALNFCIGSTAYALSGILRDHGLGANAPGLVWLAGDSVFLSIGTSCPPGPASAPAKPTDFTAVTGDARLDLRWTAPAGMLARFDLHYTSAPKTGDGAVDNDAAASGNDASAAWVDAGHAGTAVTHALTGLTNDIEYRTRVRAVNAVGAGAWAFVSGTPAELPGPPTDLGIAVSETTLDLTWTAPMGTVTGYDVHYTSASDTGQGAVGDDDAASGNDASAAWVAVSRTEADPPAASQSIASLTTGTEYRVRVRAKNAAGNSAWVRDKATPTAVPTWRLGPADRYTVQEGVSVLPNIQLSEPAPAGGLTWTLTPLFGEDVPSDRCKNYTGARARAVAADLGANPPSSFTVTAGKTQDSFAFPTATDTLYDEYDECFAIRLTPAQAVIDAGWILGSDADPDAVLDVAQIIIFNVVPPPAEPTGLTVTPENAKLDLAWTAPAGTLTGYDVHYTAAPDTGQGAVGDDEEVGGNTDASAGWVSVDRGTEADPPAASQAITGLTNGTAYRVRVRATRAASHGAWARGTGTPANPDAPSDPRNVTVTPGDAKLNIAWEAPASWGTWEAHSFFVQWKLSSAADSAWDSVRVPDGESYEVIAHTDTSLEFRGRQTSSGGIQYTVANGTAYDLRIQARSRKPNTDGTQDSHYRRGGWVTVTDTTPTADPPPAAPTGLDVQAGNRALGLAWTAPSGTVTGYDVHYTSSASVDQNAPASGNDPSAGWVDAGHPGASTTNFIAGLTNGTPYRVRVRAVNAHGAGDWVRGTGTPTADGVPVHTVTLSVSPNPVREGSPVSVTATLSSVLTLAGEVRVPLTVSDGTAAEIRIRRGETAGAAMIATAHDADSDDETLTVAIDTANLPSAIAAGSPASVEIEIRDDEGSSPLPTLVSQVCPASGRVWSATMIPEEIVASNADRYIGYLRSHPSLADMGTLTRSRFAYRNETVYGIERVFRVVSTTAVVNGSLTVRLTGAYTEAVAASLALHAGGRVFRFADAIRDPDGRTLTWRDSGLEWMANEQVGLCLTDTAVTLSYNDPVYEGQGLRLTATVPHPLKNAVTIPVHITDSLTYQETTLDDGFPGITIPAGAASGTGTIFMPHDEDTVTESYRVRLGALPAPLVAGDPNPLHVTVYDDDEHVPPAEATLRALRNPVAEGLRAQVQLALSHALDEDATIPVTVTRGTSEDGDHGTLENIEVPAGEVYVYAHIWTARDADTGDETFTVALDEANLPDGVTPGSPASIDFTITDDGEARGPPPAETTVSLYAHPNPVDEGRTLNVRVRLSSVLVGEVMIPLVVTRDTSEADDHGTLPSITIPYGYLEAIGEIETSVDADTDDETFTVALDTANLPDGVTAAGEGSVFGGPSATVTIADDGGSGQLAQGAGAWTPESPVVTIAAGGAVTEGAPAGFTLSAAPAPASDLAVAVTVAESGAFARSSALGARTVTIPAGSTSAAFTVATVDDAANEADGAVVSTLGSGAGYTVGDSASASVAVADNDTPVVTIAAGSAVTEGASVAFTLTAEPAPAADLAVAVSITQAGDFAEASALGARTVTIPAGGASAAFTVATVDDAANEADGAVVSTLGSGAGYTVGDAASASVAVADNDTPVVTIAAGSAVTEGELAVFTLTAAPAPVSDLAVTVTVGQEGAFVHSSTLGAHTVTIPAGGASATLDLLTVDDAADEPDGAIVATLASGAGYAVGAAKRARVAVADDDEPLPGIAADRGTAREAAGAVVGFTITLSHAVSHTVTVDYATADGAGPRWAGTMPARAGADYTAASGTLTFAPGQRYGSVEVTVLDDAINEGTEYFLLRLFNPEGAYLESGSGEIEGLIRNDDHLQEMWLSRFGRTVGTQVTEAVSERLSDGLSPGAHATLAGQGMDLSETDGVTALEDVLTGLAQRFGSPASDDGDPFGRHGSGDPWNDPVAAAPRLTGRELLLGSSFHVSGTGAGSGGGLSAWGRVAQGSFDGEHGDDTGRTSVDGEVMTGVLGADADYGRVLAGVAVSLSEGDGRFDSPGVDIGGQGKMESTLTTVSPYARVKLTDRVSAWGLGGWGTGDLRIRFDDGGMSPVRTDIGLRMGALGARGALLEQDGGAGLDLALKADAFFVRTDSEKVVNSVETESDTSRVRLVLEGGRRIALSETSTLRPTVELGVRHDGGDAETGTGVELGGGLSYADTASGFSIEARARVLVSHANSEYGEWGASATVRLDPGERGRGLSFSLSPAIGASSGGAERLWGARDMTAMTPGTEFAAGGGVRAEAGYGIPVSGGRYTGTPNVGYGRSDGGSSDWRVGWRLDSARSAGSGGPRMGLSLDATRSEPADGGDARHGVMLRGSVRW